MWQCTHYLSLTLTNDIIVNCISTTIKTIQIEFSNFLEYRTVLSVWYLNKSFSICLYFLSLPPVLVGFVLLYVYVLYIIVCPLVLFLMAIMLSVLHRYTDSDYPLGIFKLFLSLYLRCKIRQHQKRQC